MTSKTSCKSQQDHSARGRSADSADTVRASQALAQGNGVLVSAGAAAEARDACRDLSIRDGARSAAPGVEGGHGLASTATSVPGEVEVLFAAGRQRRAKRSVMTSARLLTQGASRGGFRGRVAFYRLSYADCREIAPRDISGLVRLLRRRFGDSDGTQLRYVWRGELGEAHGRFHYHVLVWLSERACPLRYRYPPMLDKLGLWSKGSTNSDWARDGVSYLAKYVAKQWEGDFPKGMRTHGSGGLQREERSERRWWMLPRYARSGTVWQDDWRRRVGGGFVALRTGEVMRSRYRWESWIWGEGPSGKKCRVGARFVEVCDVVEVVD